jgi:hypothetical protein
MTGESKNEYTQVHEQVGVTFVLAIAGSALGVL